MDPRESITTGVPTRISSPIPLPATEYRTPQSITVVCLFSSRPSPLSPHVDLFPPIVRVIFPNCPFLPRSLIYHGFHFTDPSFFRSVDQLVVPSLISIDCLN